MRKIVMTIGNEVLSPGDEYYECSKCGELFPMIELEKVSFISGPDDYAPELLCPECFSRYMERMDEDGA